ncbi:hypothetical protein [Micromonospora peucetia]|uniref:Uncharacterized protein n=1 Tax=Micromonospora peucetia TaxID=47871 RepID=A0A1C6VGH0_9ACTN|nr:hypothetical protein [Micromonospora peucetia]WSA30280.1 hypothetical protein OIE14_18945 [Micromonospora peucetia]SCL65423.1 hypothetical protein GA0070608_3113 [Micromonospora peucetia]
MTDLDQRIVRTLRERAEGTVDTDRLTARAVAGGRARRRRRRVGGGVALGLVAALGFTVVTGTGLPERVRPPDAAAPAVATAAPPRLASVPGAAAAPDLVGTDPQALHFGFDPARARYLGWQVGAGVESARIDVGGGRAVTVELARSVAALRQGGLEGLPQGVADMTVEAAFDGTDRPHRAGVPTPTWVRLWQPAPGLYARGAVTAVTAEEIEVAVGALRLGEARRCVAPVRLTALPGGARLKRCTVDAGAFPAALNMSLMVAGAGEALIHVAFDYARSIATDRTSGNLTIDGRPAYRYPQGGQLELLGIPKAHLIANFGWPYEGFTEADAAVLLGGAKVASDAADPQTWD